ncbi:hypothetical protein [Actinoallomurus rhizosphaericola]|uniref:hypothetical protein n=1 Tax=Actinoallomurus rhizosphaericola TaxID=2952536 RepID=UPI0020919853|nr:hypothetical protein [Actinoallomurus rhizosphaericola]MCO5993661.1 hypothetical protein [Actinoallomurus rhizosphaericola]
MTVLARDPNGQIYFTEETAQGSKTFGEWKIAQQDTATYATDPTTFTYTDSNGPTWGFIVRDADNQSHVYTTRPPTLRSLRSTGTAFVEHALPKVQAP